MLLFRNNPARFVTAKNAQRLVTVAVLLVLLLAGISFAVNYYSLQKPTDRIISRDARNQGIRVSVYYDSYLNLSTVVYDIQRIDPPAGPAGVLRAFVQLARELQGRDVEEVVIAYRGRRKLKIHGDDFLELGAALGTAQPRKLMLELAHDLRFLNDKLVMSNLPGDYAALLKKSLGEGSEDSAAGQLMRTIRD